MEKLLRAGALLALAASIVAAMFHAGFVHAQAATQPTTGVAAVTTYESAGLYWQSPGGTAGCEVKYRKNGDTAWKQGLAMWYDARDGQCRGSIVGLEAGAWYQAELNLPGQAASRGVAFQTWSNQKPVAKTIAINGGTAQYNVTEGGSPAGWVVYEGNGATLDGQNTAIYNIHVRASYVIVRGLTLRGARQDAIRLDPTVHDVIIEDNDISNWGRTRDGVLATNMDSAIRGYCSSQDQLVRITIQRNHIHDPRYGANSWSDGHPAGAQAVALSHCGGQLVIRHNDMYSSPGKYFNDIIGGEDNFTKVGFPNADSDIYGNRLSHAWDDAIEAEGANENVRIWGNYIDKTAIGIATTATTVGPAYVFRNVWNRAQMYEKAASLDQDDRQPFFKSGGDNSLGHGRRYLIHNTMLQATQAGLQYGLGGGFGLGGTGSAQLIENTYSYNNVYHQWKDGKGFTYQTGSTSRFVSDMYNGTAGDTTVSNGVAGKPVYVSGHGWQSEAGGNYQLAANSPGFGRGTKVANFNDGVSAPDVGAHQSGTPSMRFGVAASPGSSVGGGASAGPDLSVSQVVETPSPGTNKDVVFAITVANNGAAAASGVSVTSTFDSTAVAVWAAPGCTQQGARITCAVGSLAGGATSRVKIVLRKTSGPLMSTAAVSFSAADPTPANNSDTKSVALTTTPAGKLVTRYRLYSPITLEHHFTTDANEYLVLGRQVGIWVQEGAAGRVFDNPGSHGGVAATAYYRLYNPGIRQHHWTSDANEYYTLAEGPGWNAEGVDGYILPTQATGSTPLYRLNHPGLSLHHWTTDAHEYSTLVATGAWVGEGVSGFVVQ